MKTKKVLAIVIAAVLLLMYTAVGAEEVNLLEMFDPGFEGASLLVTTYHASMDNTSGHDSEHSVEFSDNKGQISVTAAVQSGTNYTFSFWMKNSVENALKVTATAMVGNTEFDTVAAADSATYDWYISGMGVLGTYNVGAAREGEAINIWRKVSMNFTTPYTGCDGASLKLKCAVADTELRVDDLCLIETGKAPNCVFGGNFEALDEASAILKPVGFTTQSTTNTNFSNGDGDLYVAGEGDNHYVHFSADTAVKSRAVAFPNTLVMKGASLGKRYKISFKYRNPGSSVPGVRIYGDSNRYLDKISQFPAPTMGIWETYNLYINATDLINAGLSSTKTVQFGYVYNTIFEEDLDDLYVYYDQNELGFYQDLTFYNNGSGSRFFSGSSYFDNALSSEKAVAVQTLSELTASDGYKTVTARAHILPVEKEDHTFDTQTAALLVGVYKYEDGEKTLVDVRVATDSSADGKVLDPYATVRVPENTGTATYKAEAVAWDSADNMAPLMQKAVLE